MTSKDIDTTLASATAPVATPLPAQRHVMGDDSWEVARERIDAAWFPMVDAKGRVVHGYAVISETPSHVLGRTLKSKSGSTSWNLGTLPFRVALIATRDGGTFGAIPRETAHATRELAHAHAIRALRQQGKRYARKFGA